MGGLALRVRRRRTGSRPTSCNAAYVADWQKTHPAEVAEWIKANPDTPEPKPEDLAVPFFTDYSKAHPGTFPSAVEHKTADGKTEKASSRSRKARTSRRPSSTCGCRSIRTWTWSVSRPTW